jgi:hypothetical protein
MAQSYKMKEFKDSNRIEFYCDDGNGVTKVNRPSKEMLMCLGTQQIEKMTLDDFKETLEENKFESYEIDLLATKLFRDSIEKKHFQVLMDHGFHLSDAFIRQHTTHWKKNDKFIERITGKCVYDFHINETLSERFFESLSKDDADDCFNILHYGHVFNKSCYAALLSLRMPLFNKNTDLLKEYLTRIDTSQIGFNIICLLVERHFYNTLKTMAEFGISFEPFNQYQISTEKKEKIKAIVDLGLDENLVMYFWNN